jgi:hypothetical protein
MTIPLQVGVTYAATDEFVWAKSYSGEIQKRALDASGSNTTATTNVGAGLGLYAYGNYLYICYGQVRRVGLDGTGATTLRTLADIYSVVSDGTYLYYGYENTQKIGRMNMDGSNANDSWVTFSGVTGLYAAWMTISNGVLYFGGGANATAKVLGSVPTSGGTPTVLYTDSTAIAGITTDGTYLYWVHFTSGNLSRSLLDGSGVTVNYVTGLGTNVWDVEYWNGYLYVSANTNIAKVKADGTGLQATYITGMGDRGMAITGTPVSATTLTNSVLPTLPSKGTVFALAATFSAPGKVVFYANGKKIAGCIQISTSVSPPYQASCNWKPANKSLQRITAVITPTSSSFLPLTAYLGQVSVQPRTTRR